MRFSLDRLGSGIPASRSMLWTTLALLTLFLSACGGSGGSSADAEPPVAAAECDPNDPATFDQCGILYVGLTDGDGDFLHYNVNAVSLTLEKANGAVVETLPNSSRIDFASYVDLTELVSAANIPPGTYVAGTIRLAYSDAEIFVEDAGAAKEAIVVDSDGNPVDEIELNIRLSDRDQLFIARGRPAFLTVDFDLEASHTVDLAPTPATAVSEPFIVAEIEPVDTKDIRVRGPLLEVNLDASQYTVNLRPFHRRDGDFGKVPVNVTDDTEYEINGVNYAGSAGLEALDAAGPGTPTVAIGVLDTSERTFTAVEVLAGDSVPGIDFDAVKGNVIARDGNRLTVRGATVIPRDREVFFNDDVIVNIGPDTQVFKYRVDTPLSIDDISVGQKVLVRGNIDTSSTNIVSLDATAGRVRMYTTHLSGTVQMATLGQLNMRLSAIDRRRVEIHDFAGTGSSPDNDADPANYEVLTGNLPMDNLLTDAPVQVFGFPTAFGTAPADFEGRTLVDFTDVRAVLGVGWGFAGTTTPFLSMGSDGLVLDNANPDIDIRHYVKQGSVLIDLTELDSSTSIVPADSGRTVFAIITGDSLQVYTNFNEFVAELTEALNGATTARSMYARGEFDANSNVLSARKIGIHLLEPN